MTANISKTVRLGTSETFGGRSFSVYAHIKLIDGKLSITGVEGPLPGGNALGSCGQIEMSRPNIKTLAPGWTRKTLAKFWDVWHEWHLNDMRSACEHQRDLGWTYNDHHDPETFKGEACPTCGYSIGSKWLFQELPDEVVEFLQTLPVSDKEPAWV